MTAQSQPSPLAGVSIVWIASLITAAIIAGASIAGIVYQASIYPGETLRRWFVLNDAVNLAAGLPLLLGSLWLARRGRLIGLLCWPGALFYVLYVYTGYLIAVPFGALFPAYLALVALSAYTLIGLGASIDGRAVRERLDGRIPARTIGGILLGLAVLTILRQVATIIGALAAPSSVTAQTLASWIADLAVMCPALLITGIQMWQRKPLGYVAGPGLLLQFGVLALGLIPGLALQSPADAAGMVIVAVMAVICLVPFALLVRAAAAGERPVELSDGL